MPSRRMSGKPSCRRFRFARSNAHPKAEYLPTLILPKAVWSFFVDVTLNQGLRRLD